MFDQLKVNKNSIINLLKVPERDNQDFSPVKTGNDFLSMVMEKRGYSDKDTKDSSRTERAQEQFKEGENSKSEQKDLNQDNAKVSAQGESNRNPADKDTQAIKNSTGNETEKRPENDVRKSENRKDNAGPVKETSNKKRSGREPEDEIINQLYSESNNKKIIDIIRAAIKGDKKAEDESFQKLFSSLKSKRDTLQASSIKKEIPDKTQGSITGFSDAVLKELKDSIKKELGKVLDNRKPDSRFQRISDRELKQIASNILEGLKKNKPRDALKHEVRNISAEDLRIDRKPVTGPEQQLLKKMESSDDSSFERNGSKERNTGRDSYSYNGGRIDFSSKAGLEKAEHSLKMYDFKENLQDIMDKAKITVRDNRNGSFVIKLNPQELGNVNVNLIMENGVITGKFLVDNDDAKSVLLNNLGDLKYQLEEAGISVGDFSVDVSSQRERYLAAESEENRKPVILMNSDKDIIAAAEQYYSNGAVHDGYINMVI